LDNNSQEIVIIDDVRWLILFSNHYWHFIVQPAQIRSYINPWEVLNLITKKTFSAKAIVLDINMPTKNGWEFLAEAEKQDFTYLFICCRAVAI
jgi:DNA-binding NtrC family response regulator